MELIVAVYDDWGIGKDGTQPIALSADRKFFREMTRGAMVIAGRRTIADFPGQKPLPGRVNVAITRNNIEIPGFTVCHSVEEAAQLASTAEKAMECLGALRGCEVHSSVILSPVDEKTFKRLGINLTCQPQFKA